MTDTPRPASPLDAWAQVQRYHKNAWDDMETATDGSWCLVKDVDDLLASLLSQSRAHLEEKDRQIETLTALRDEADALIRKYGFGRAEHEIATLRATVAQQAQELETLKAEQATYPHHTRECDQDRQRIEGERDVYKEAGIVEACHVVALRAEVAHHLKAIEQRDTTIENLKVELEKARAERDQQQADAVCRIAAACGEVEALKAEQTRLRSALEQISREYDNDFASGQKIADAMVVAARAALASSSSLKETT